MPAIEVRTFSKSSTDIPLMIWLEQVKKRDRKAYDLCLYRTLRLSELGHQLNQNRSESAYLEDGIYELRIKSKHVNYRILYWFHNNKFACLSHGFTKEARVPPQQIATALKNKALVEQDPDKYTTTFDT